jgi:phosphoesterase RecJ-like protein
MLPTLVVHDGRIATALITTEMFDRAGATSGDTEGLIDYPRSIAGVEAAALLRQVGVDQFKVSLRSRGEVDVEKIARRNGGGGHRNAAGFLADGPLETVRTQVVEELQQALV